MIRIGRKCSHAILIVAVLAALFPIVVTAQQTERAKKVGGKLLCGVGTPLCNCNQILTQCNHVGCSNSTTMLKELDEQVARGDADDLILQTFIQKYGTAVLAEPPKTGFSRVAWFIPSITLTLGLIVVLLVMSRWLRRPATATPNRAPGISEDFLARARQQADRETED